MVQGNAGQFLRVKVNLGKGSDPTNSVSARHPGTTMPLEALREGGDCSGNFIYRLPETGAYPVELDSAGRDASIAFSLLAADDPMVTPGIKREEISIDFGSFAKQGELALVPFGQWEGCMDDWQPSHWGLENDHFEFRIMQVAGYKKVFGAHLKGDLAVMENLEAALKVGAKIPADITLPYPTYGDTGLNFSTHPQVLDREGWRGLRRIGAYAQDDGCIFGPQALLAYVFEGLTNDGRFFILMRAGVSNPQVGQRLEKECTAGAKAAGANSDTFFKKEMPAIFDRDIAAADPASFKPSLDQLDAVIRSLKLKR
jgi:hypothetical protein